MPATAADVAAAAGMPATLATQEALATATCRAVAVAVEVAVVALAAAAAVVVTPAAAAAEAAFPTSMHAEDAPARAPRVSEHVLLSHRATSRKTSMPRA